ncbi:MAG TPA: enoyl-CoA hydratase-related protein [Dehalococcoidia bacterium]|nr:enoyl-CoA hydratase-related protein [Dehalococcoidia bacterium]
MGEPLRVERDGPVARVVMTRAEVHNAFDEELIPALAAAFAELGSDVGVRVVILAGEGRSFSAGADLEWMRRLGEASEAENREDARMLAAMLRTVTECPKPVVARVHGNAFGGGVGLVACADIAVVVEGARFGFTEVRLGLAPATIAPWVLGKIDAGHVLPLFLTGEWFDAEFAAKIGLVHGVVEADELDESVERVVQSLLAGGPVAQAAVKRLAHRISVTEPAIDEYTAEVIASLRTGEEGREGVRAFLEKRKPAWSPENQS